MKDNDIECNLRAALSFLFVSKVTGVDAIEMVTKVMLGLLFEPYQDVTLPPGYAGVNLKVPRFSFSRLSGADSGDDINRREACFGRRGARRI